MQLFCRLLLNKFIMSDNMKCPDVICKCDCGEGSVGQEKSGGGGFFSGLFSTFTFIVLIVVLILAFLIYQFGSGVTGIFGRLTGRR
jgi:hypothetical protein